MSRPAGIERKGWGRALAAAFALALVASPAGPARAAVEPPAGVEEVVRLVAASHGLPEGVRFRQEVTFRALLGTWRFHSEVEAAEGGLRFTIHGAPSFVPQSLPRDLIDLSRSPALFDLSVAGGALSDGTLVLSGPRIAYAGTGPREATFWIDPGTWTIRRAEAEYSWGTLYVDQEFDRMGDHYLLTRQQARVSPFGFTLDVRYVEYRLP